MQALLSAALASCALSAPTAPVSPYGPPAPTYVPAPVPYADEVPVYQYTYAVKDDYSFSNFNAHEERDGYNAAGGYQVALPDGRTQIVTYTATKVSIILTDMTHSASKNVLKLLCLQINLSLTHGAGRSNQQRIVLKRSDER